MKHLQENTDDWNNLRLIVKLFLSSELQVFENAGIYIRIIDVKFIR